MAAIETDALTRRYGEVVAVDSVDLTVEQGEVFGFLGPNGAGKSTVINMLLDYTPPSSGEARVFGHPTRTEAVDIRERVGVLPDGYQLYDRLSGRRHLEFVVQARGADDDPDEILDRVGLDPEDAERNAGDYSKGMAQRLVLGMALVDDPDLLILDEPSTGLDPNGIRLMRDVIRQEVNRGATVFFSSHILGQVEAVCDRVGIMNEGRLIEVASLDEIRDTVGVGTTLHVTVDSQPDLTISDLEAMDDVSNVRADGPELTMSLSDSTAKARVISRIEDAGATVTDFETTESSLEELFAALIDEDETAEVSA
ncbi:ABC-2 type transport system ATP-binding protein [Halorientalis persicus]|jgi:ABC-2 type transport system ATP-binding protein|uniref:ABC-2 type transport system ATP-binding protein n=1 Tax=Halorientalis persicus TaxID=1367881 RepID=A0A1H8ETT8_9EURY|nr:ABC transporter ATP-binding protein [Halorientalis persicus]SEN22544.1 ABC-2 type transport system ATP-binding protein [Halorientalis persicus]